MKKKNNKHLVVCDGGKRSGIAYGSYKVFDDNGKLYAHHFMMFGFGTSNVAEYLAFINALEFCTREGIVNIEMQGDSALMINQVLGNWKTNDPRLKRLRNLARKKLKRFHSYKLIKIHNTEVKEILGH